MNNPNKFNLGDMVFGVFVPIANNEIARLFSDKPRAIVKIIIEETGAHYWLSGGYSVAENNLFETIEQAQLEANDINNQRSLALMRKG